MRVELRGRSRVGCLFFGVDVIDGAQQCSVLQVMSCDIDGIIHRHVFGCFRCFRVTWAAVSSDKGFH